MAEQSQREIERNERLDALSDAVTSWADKEEKRLTDDVAFMRSVLKGRTGAGRLADQNVVDASALLVDEINQFLEG